MVRRIYKSEFSSMDTIGSLAEELGCHIGFSEDISPLWAPMRSGRLIFPNRIAIQPMEGADADIHGAPTEHTRERYLKYAEGCAGLIWFEACSIDFPEARTHDRMLMINEKNLPKFEDMIRYTKDRSETNLSEIGLKGRATFVLQLSHAGRYRVERSKRSPAMAYRFPVLDKAFGVTRGDGRIITDMEFERLKVGFVDAASMAFDAGFDAVDVKSCHGYLLNDLLSAFMREGKFGGERLENRSRFILETVAEIRKETRVSVTIRLSVYDGISRPYGFGTSSIPGAEESKYERLADFDPTEPVMLIRELKKIGVDFVNISMGNPYFSQFLTRPFDVKMPGQRDSPEHPMKYVARHFEIVKTMRREVPNMAFVGSGYSWLRQYGINAAAYNVATSRTDVAGWGRLAFAFPDFPKIAFLTGALPSSRVCITCSGCSRLLRAGFQAGCVVQNPGAFRESMKKLKEMGK